jgi:hypothetical protein
MLVLFSIAIALILLAILRLARVWLLYRGDRVARCPETRRLAGVRVNAIQAAVSSLGGKPRLRLEHCTRWPLEAGCGQECLRDIQAAPAECLVRTIAGKWYEGKSCSACGRPIGHIEWGPSQPALFCPDKGCIEWNQVTADRLPETLESAKPVCFACHLASKLYREHPELVTVRERRG